MASDICQTLPLASYYMHGPKPMTPAGGGSDWGGARHMEEEDHGRQQPGYGGGRGGYYGFESKEAADEAAADDAALAKVGPGNYLSLRHRMPFNLRNEGSKCVG